MDDQYEMDAGDWAQLEYDMCLAMNMMLGEPYEQASESAKQWVKEARE